METIVIIEDDESIREMLRYYFRSVGYEVACFESGEDYFEKEGEVKPSLYILDIMLPEEDGISILKKLRADSRTRGIQVILLTGLVGQDTILMKEQGIVDEIVLKPIRFKELLDVMEQMASEKDEEGDDGKGFRKNEGQAADRADSDGDGDFSDWL